MTNALWTTWLAPGCAISARDLAQVDWTEVLTALHDHDVAATLYVSLRSCNLLHGLPPHALKQLEEDYQRAKLRAMLWQRGLRIVLPALSNGGVEIIPFKGAALAFLCYEDAAMRSMADVDLWVDAKDMDRARGILEGLGFEVRENASRPMAQQAQYDGEMGFYGKDIGVPLVELHWGVFPGEWMARTAAVDHAAMRQRLIPATLLGTPVHLMSPEDHLIQVAVHASISHAFCSAALRSMLDLVVIAQAGLDWSVVVQRSREWRLATTLGHTLALAGEIYHNAPMLTASAQLISPLRLRILRGFASPQSILRKKPLDRSLAKWFYLLFAVDHPYDCLRLVARSLWPERSWLRARYGNHKWRTRVKHLIGATQGHF